ncbi:MAG: diacylglycerol kinase family protein [Chloroflexia bacterium]
MAQAIEPLPTQDDGSALTPPTQAELGISSDPEKPQTDNFTPGTTVRVIINPVSGKKGGFTTNSSGPDEVRAALAENNIEAEILETQYAGHATELAQQAVRDNIDIVIACGGDGTVSEVAKALINKKKTTLGILPLGSANNVARMTGVPFDLADAVRTLRTGAIKAIDVGRCNGEYVLETAGVGLDAALFPILNKVDSGEYIRIWDAITTIFKFRQRSVTLVLDKRAVRVRALVVLVANGPYWGYSLPLAPDARIDDHRFEVVVFRNFSKTDFVRHVFAALFHRGHIKDSKGQELAYTHHPKIRTYTARRVQVLTHGRRAPWPVHADALPRGTTPALIELIPNALRVITGS